jgi:hypothetical protein
MVQKAHLNKYVKFIYFMQSYDIKEELEISLTKKYGSSSEE